MICPVCQMQNRDNARFCKKCGYHFQLAENAAGIPEAPPTPGTASNPPMAEGNSAFNAAASAVPDDPPAPVQQQPSAPLPPLEQPVATQIQAEQPVTQSASPPMPPENINPSSGAVLESDEPLPPVAHPAPQEPRTAPTASNEAEDPTLAPTLILTPEKMMAYHQQRWQKEEKQPQNDPAKPSDISDIPTTIMPSGEATPPQDIADQPTILAAPTTGPGGSQEPSAVVNQTTDPASAPAQAIANQQNATIVKDEHMDEQPLNAQSAEEPTAVAQPPLSAEEQPAQSTEFAPLVVGTLLNNRFEITQVEESDQSSEHLYQVTDHQGWQRCWNCRSESNAEDDEYCIDCGAEMQGVSYTLHEYPSTSNKSEESNVLQGNIVQTFVDQGRTYVVEQEQIEQNPFPNGVFLLAAGDSDAGNIRRSDPNEDSVLVLQMQRVHESNSLPVGAFIVADGMGGHDAGQVASRITINTISQKLIGGLFQGPIEIEKQGQSENPPKAPDLPDDETLGDLLHSSVQEANAQLCQKNQNDKTDMGSTLTGFMVVGHRAYIVNVGDSRTYMVRAGQLYQLTTDHSLVGQLVAGGLIQPDDVYTHPQRSQIFRSLGDKLNVQIDILKQDLHPGDILLSCSDGLWEMVRNPQIESILNNAPNPQTACTQLLEAANMNGGEDNVSAVVVFVR